MSVNAYYHHEMMNFGVAEVLQRLGSEMGRYLEMACVGFEDARMWFP